MLALCWHWGFFRFLAAAFYVGGNLPESTGSHLERVPDASEANLRPGTRQPKTADSGIPTHPPFQAGSAPGRGASSPTAATRPLIRCPCGCQALPYGLIRTHKHVLSHCPVATDCQVKALHHSGRLDRTHKIGCVRRTALVNHGPGAYLNHNPLTHKELEHVNGQDLPSQD
jgi:hypothetical protein